jgi:hypothetical protein
LNHPSNPNRIFFSFKLQNKKLFKSSL